MAAARVKESEFAFCHLYSQQRAVASRVASRQNFKAIFQHSACSCSGK